jgi:hypothetical protein
MTHAKRAGVANVLMGKRFSFQGGKRREGEGRNAE